MHRMAGSVGCGGGSLAFLFSPLGGLQSQMLPEQLGDQRHPRMPMQARNELPSR